MKKNQGITLIALVITIIVLLILAGITINLTIGSNGIISMSKKAKEEHEIGEILDRLELEKVDLVAKKGGEIPTVQEYADHVTQKGVIDDAEQIDENNSYVTVGNYMFLVEKEADGNIKITYQGKVNNDSNEPIQVKIIKLNKETIDLEKGEEETLTATIFPKTATNKEIVWSSSNEEVATVDNQGKVTAVKGGEANIIATAADGSGVSASCKIAIPVPPPSVEVSTSSHTAKQITYTWPELAELAKLISDKSNVITRNTAEVAVSINGKDDKLGIGDWTTANGKKVRILGFNHDTLANKKAYIGNESTGTGNTYAGISFEFVDPIGSAVIYNASTTTSGGWEVCNARAVLNSTIYNSIGIKSIIKKVIKPYQSSIGASSASNSSGDFLWLLSMSEIFAWTASKGYGDDGYSKVKEGERYLLYAKNIPSNYSDSSGDDFLKKPSKTSPVSWALRSIWGQNNTTFKLTTGNGNTSGGNTWNGASSNLAPGFCI